MSNPLDIYKVNIFDNYMHLKIWGQMFSKACGSVSNNVKPNEELVYKLTTKFIEDYTKFNGKNTNRNSS